MPFTTTEQAVMLAAVLLGGLLIGFAMAPSPGRWKRKAIQQARSFTAYQRDAEDRLRAANQRAADLKAEGEALRTDFADAERTIAGLRAAALVKAEQPVPLALDAIVSPVEPLPVEPSADTGASLAGASEPDLPGMGWSADSTQRDDLTRLRGLDEVLNTRLFGLGVTRFEDIEKLSAEDEMALEQRLSLPVGYIAREQWRTQAALLRAGEDDDHAAQFATPAGVPAA